MKLLSILALTLVLASCSSYGPDAGHEVVLIKKPWFFGHGGVVDSRSRPADVHRHHHPRHRRQHAAAEVREPNMDDTMTSDGVPITFHAISCCR